MVNDHLIHVKSYVQSASALDHLIFDKTLQGRLAAFLLACQMEELSPRTIEYYQDTIGRFISGVQARSPEDITTDQIRLYLLQLQTDHAPGGVHAHYRAIKRFYNWMVLEGNLPAVQNPMSRIRAPRRPKTIIKPFTEGDIRRMLTVCPGTFHGVRDAAMIWIFIDTGLRVSEMVRIDLRDVDIAERTILVTGKGSKQRIVRYGRRALKALLKYHQLRKPLSDALWISEGGVRLTREGILQMVQRVCRRANVTGVRCSPHTFRHFFGTYALKNGAELWQVQKILGHETLSTTQLYQRTVGSWDALPGHDKFSPGDHLP